MMMWRIMCCGLLSVAGCQTAFAPSETDLMQTPPPRLTTDANAFWNDQTTGIYGEFTVGAAEYDFNNQLCRTARVTSINGATHVTQDRILLYCADSTGRYDFDPAVSCRSSAAGTSIACPQPNGDEVTLLPR
jgi:hypothetical protein